MGNNDETQTKLMPRPSRVILKTSHTENNCLYLLTAEIIKQSQGFSWHLIILTLCPLKKQTEVSVHIP